ncbi:MAG: cell division FtsZ family protein [Deltaproteobacteria bacterium]|jgi:cell division protein FtsZ|nr:cell division FtsZ family protein [Deltaproteobacteria bacterium]
MSEDFSFLGKSEDLKLSGIHKLRVLGIGGCGNKAIDHMVNMGIEGVEFVAANTDPNDLKVCQAPVKILLGEKITRGEGCGGDPEVGTRACKETLDHLKSVLEGTDLLFIVAGLGGGTGSGGAPVVAEAFAAMEHPPLIVSVVTTPFSWEEDRQVIAKDILKELTRHSNAVITVSNSILEELVPDDFTYEQTAAKGNDVLYKAVSGIVEILMVNGKINCDFADVRKTLECRGPALIAFGEASGENRAKKALQNAIDAPLVSEHSIKGAKRLLIYIVGDKKLLMSEFKEINKLATEMGGKGVKPITGLAEDPSLAESGIIRVIIIATGLDNEMAWDEPQKPQEEVINLTALADEPDVNVRSTDDVPVRKTLAGAFRPVPQVPASPADPVGIGAIKPTILRPQPQKEGTGLHSNQTNRVVRPLTGSGQASRYQQNAGVDPGGANPPGFETPTFLRNNAN